MKIITVIFFIITVSGQSQNFKEILKDVSTPEQAKYFVAKYPTQSVVRTYYSDKDSLAYQKKLLAKKVGDTMKTGNSYVKVLELKSVNRLKVSYIVIDATSLTLKQADSLRNNILPKCVNGGRFSELKKEYEILLSPGIIVKDYAYSDESIPELEIILKKYKVGQVFFVDDTIRKLYYIIRKDAEDFSRVESVTALWLKTAGDWPSKK